jgi:adenosyl cobinamide kinase/adenosyl cobinamide phosphate guanylyltransferase
LITLVLGGARSGKSALAEQLARRGGTPVIYLATAVAADDDFAERIAGHRARRPAEWLTIESGPDLLGGLRQVAHTDPGATVLIESLGTWVASVPGFAIDAPGVVGVLTGRQSPSIVVSEEVGLGVHPSTELGGRFRDALGTLNQAVAAAASAVYLVVAGRPLLLGPPLDRDGWD